MSPENSKADADRETLSALFDGELHGEAARFALKRLGHDTQWQQTCGNWQLIGDVLRGRGTSAASTDFAARVAEAVAQEPAVVMEEPSLVFAAAPPVRRSRVRGWAGGAALAATVAVAALFVTRPPALDGGAAPMPAVAVEQAPVAAPANPPAPAVPAIVPSAVPETAVAEVVEPRAATISQPRQRTRVAPATRLANTAPRANRAAASRATAALVASEAAPSPSSTAQDPFRPAQEIVTRPWPRAVLPNSQAAGALTASFDSPAVSPSFYPFEPQLQAEAPLPPPPQP